MLKLIQYELKKIFSASFLKIILVLLLVVNVIFCADFTQARADLIRRPLLQAAFEEYQKDPQAFLRGYEDLMRYYEEAATPANPFPQDPYRFGGSAWGITDWDIYEEVLEEVEADSRYEEKISSMVSQAKRIRQGLPDKDSYNYHYQNTLIKIYSSLQDRVSFKEELVFSWDLLFSYESDYFPLFLVVILGTAYLALCDKQNGFYAISGVCRKGRSATVCAKLLSSLILSFAIVLLFSLSTVITVGVVGGGYSTPFEAVQAMQEGYGYTDMTYFPFALNMWQGYLLAIFFKICAASILTAFVFFVSMLVQRMWLSFLCGGGLAAFCYFISRQEIVGNFTQWRYLNLQSLFLPDQILSRYRAVDFFGNVMELNGVLYLFLITFISLILLLSLWLYPRRKKTKISLKDFSRLLSPPLTVKRIWLPPLSLNHYERVKNRIFPALFILLVILKCVTSSAYYQPDTNSYDRIYKDYIDDTIGGVYTEEKMERILYEMDWFQEVVFRYEEMNEKYYANEISSDEFMRYLREYSSANLKLKVLTDLRKQATYLEKLSMQTGILGSFVYDTGYSRLIYQGVDWILLLFICIFSARQYLVEFEKSASGSSMYTLVQSTKRGRAPLFVRKSLNCAFVVLPVWMIFKGIDLYFLLKNFDLPDLNIPLVSLSVYAGAPGSVTLLEYWVGITVLSFLGTLLLSWIIFLVAFFVKKQFLVYGLTVLVVCIPHFAAETGVSLASFVDLTMLYNTDALFRQGKLPGICLFFAVMLVAVFTGMLFAKKKVKEGGAV